MILSLQVTSYRWLFPPVLILEVLSFVPLSDLICMSKGLIAECLSMWMVFFLFCTNPHSQLQVTNIILVI